MCTVYDSLCDRRIVVLGVDNVVVIDGGRFKILIKTPVTIYQVMAKGASQEKIKIKLPKVKGVIPSQRELWQTIPNHGPVKITITKTSITVQVFKLRGAIRIYPLLNRTPELAKLFTFFYPDQWSRILAR